MDEYPGKKGGSCVPKTRGDRAASVAVVASHGHSQIHIYTHSHIHGNAGTGIYIPTSAHCYLVAHRYLSSTGGVHVHAPAAHLHTGARHSYQSSIPHRHAGAAAKPRQPHGTLAWGAHQPGGCRPPRRCVDR